MSPRYLQYRNFLLDNNYPKYRYVQLIDSIYKQYKSDFRDILVLPQTLRNKLVKEYGDTVLTVKSIRNLQSKQAAKVLFHLRDGNRIESVQVKYSKGQMSLCISTQIGCKGNCPFCSTGKIGLKRNLIMDEIIDQVLYFKQKGNNIKSIAFQGMGEPLLNPNTFKALNILTSKRFMNISQRAISISTVGILPGLKRIIKEFPQINIAFSLHSPFNDERSKLVPFNKKYPLGKVLKVLDGYILRTHRKVFIEYLVLKGLNDSIRHMKGISRLLHNRHLLSHLYHVNLQSYNSSKLTAFPYSSSLHRIYKCRDLLMKFGHNVTLRPSFGKTICASCGQLYADYVPNQTIKKLGE